MKKYLAECIGTATLVILGCGTAMLVGCDAANGGGYILTALAFGLTIVAMGTSLPEAAVSISAALKGGETVAITIGNVLGSNIMNVLVILGLTSVICAIPVQKSTVRYEIPFTILITVVLAGLGLWDNQVSRIEGGILWGFMLLYLLYLLKMAKNGNGAEEEQKEEEPKPTEAPKQDPTPAPTACLCSYLFQWYLSRRLHRPS